MAPRAGFAEADITPPLGTHKIGWLKVIVSDRVLDPVMAKAAVLESEGERIGFVQLDTCFVEAADVAEMRRRIEARHGLPGAHLMVAATHNHAGPAVADCGDVRRDAACTESMIARVADLVGRAVAALRPAEVGMASVAEFDVSWNRRVVLRDGSVGTQHLFDAADSLWVEGPIDPEVAVLAARTPAGEPLGAIVNFACHPTHHGGETALSAGYPGCLAAGMRARGWPVTVFLNGACGNLIHFDATHGGAGRTKEEVGRALADDAARAIAAMTFRRSVALRAASRTVRAPWRRVTEEDLRGTARGAQRFIDPAIYERMIPRALAEMRASDGRDVEVQVLSVDEYDYAGIPAEYFVQNGLRIKEGAHPRHALVVSNANGMMAYVPHEEAFARGGYETTFPGSLFAPETGRLLAEAALALIKGE